VRVLSPLLLILCLAGCQRSGPDSSDAVRQGVIDHLVQAKFDVTKMDIKVSAVKLNGEQADATVAVTLKGNTDAPAMNFSYHLEHQDKKWVVVGQARESTAHGAGAVPGAAPPNAGGANPHGGAMPPAAAGSGNPHGGAPPAGGAAGMPSPQDLPPAKKK
jgi:hypothetical protein